MVRPFAYSDRTISSTPASRRFFTICSSKALARSLGAITLFTEDLAGSKSFYQDVFGLPVFFEDENSAVFKFENTVINLLTDPGGHIWEIA